MRANTWLQEAVDSKARVMHQLADVDACFAGETVEAILDALHSHDSDLAREALQSMSRYWRATDAA